LKDLRQTVGDDHNFWPKEVNSVMQEVADHNFRYKIIYLRHIVGSDQNFWAEDIETLMTRESGDHNFWPYLVGIQKFGALGDWVTVPEAIIKFDENFHEFQFSSKVVAGVMIRHTIHTMHIMAVQWLGILEVHITNI
jgi:hypothetical protein